MDDGLVRAYLDDYREIEVIIDKKFCEGKSNAFYLMDGKQSFPLELISSKEHITYYSYKLKYSGDIDVGTEYQIMVANAFKCVLQYRFIVKTERFNREFFYEGSDLGSSLLDKYTKFAIWARRDLIERVITVFPFYGHLRGGVFLIWKANGAKFGVNRLSCCVDRHIKREIGAVSIISVRKHSGAAHIVFYRPSVYHISRSSQKAQRNQAESNNSLFPTHEQRLLSASLKRIGQTKKVRI